MKSPTELQHLAISARQYAKQARAYYAEDKYADAAQRLNEAIMIYRELIDHGQDRFQNEALEAQGLLGNVYFVNKHYDEGIAVYTALVKNLQRLVDDGQKRFRKVLAATKNNLGLSYQEKRLPLAAEKYFAAAIADYDALVESGYRELRMPLAECIARRGRAMAYSGQMEEGLLLLQRALDSTQALTSIGYASFKDVELGIRFEIARFRYEYGQRLLRDNKYEAALVEFREGREEDKLLFGTAYERVPLDLLMAGGQMGVCLCASGNPREGEVYLVEAVRRLEDLANKDPMAVENARGMRRNMEMARKLHIIKS